MIDQVRIRPPERIFSMIRAALLALINVLFGGSAEADAGNHADPDG